MQVLHPHFQLSGPFGKLEAPALRTLVDEEKGSVQKKAILLARPTPDFVAKVLAHLETQTPAAILSPDLSLAEREAREKILQQNLHPETALVLFTSGSTGAPKAVQLSWKNIAANTEAVLESLAFAQATQQNLFLSLSYSYGLLGQLLPAIQAGVPTHLLAFPEARSALLAGKGAGMWSGVPAHWETLLRVTSPEQCDSVTHVISAGAALPLELRARLRGHFRQATIFNNYGLTECSPRVLSLASTHPRFLQEGTVGYPVKHLQVKTGPEGELLVRGPQVMLGYVGEAGEAKIQDGWLHSGDVVEHEADGMVKIVGRLDELFNIGGERTSPLEIEAALLQLEGVKEAAVLVEPHDLYGAKITAFLVGAEALKRKDAVTQLRQWLSGHKVPLEYFRLPQLPRTPNGKLQRKELAKARVGAERVD